MVGVRGGWAPSFSPLSVQRVPTQDPSNRLAGTCAGGKGGNGLGRVSAAGLSQHGALNPQAFTKTRGATWLCPFLSPRAKVPGSQPESQVKPFRLQLDLGDETARP